MSARPTPAPCLLLLALLLLSPLRPGAAEGHEEGAALPRHGDEAVYEWDPGDGHGPQVRLHVRWNGTERTHDAWGNAVDVDVAEVGRGLGPSMWYAFPGGSDLPLYHEQAMSRPEDPESLRLRTYSAGDQFLRSDLCFLRAGWQGIPFSRLPSVPLADLCHPLLERGNRLADKGEEDVRGIRARRFEVMDGDRASSTLWLAEGVPFPLALSTCTRGPFDPCRAESLDSFGATLVSYRRGEGPPLLPPAAQAHPRARPAEEFQPYRQAPADGGTGNFTLERALAASERDERLSQWRSWREAHSDATLFEASYAARATSPAGLRQETWHLRWTAGDGSGWSIHAHWDAPCADLPPGADAPPELSPCKVRLQGQRETCTCTPGAPPLRSLTLGAALRRYLGEADAEAAAYGFRSAMAGAAASRGVVFVESATPPEGGFPGRRAEYDMETGALLEETYKAFPGRPGPATSQENVLAAAPGTSGARPGGSLPAAGFLLAAGGLAAVLALARVLRLPAAAVALYTRLAREDVQAHPRRAALLAAIEDTPGATLDDLEQITGFGGGALRHHVEVLARSGYVTRVRSGGVVRHFVAGSTDHGRMQELAVFMGDSAEGRVFRLVASKPGVHAADLARELGVSPAAVHYVVKALAEKGLVREERAGRRVRLFPRGN